MLKKARQAERDFNRRQSEEFARTHAGDGSFTYNGYEGNFWIRRAGDGLVDLDVYYPLGKFAWLDRSDVERQVQNFRSALELLKMIDGALDANNDENEEVEGGNHEK